MANKKSAAKAARQSEKRRMVNRARKSDVKSGCKKVLSAIEAGDFEKASELFVEVEAKIFRAYRKGVFKKNTASRKIGRLARKLINASGKSGKELGI
jgi:small subunit ribosomal protein S20